MSTLSGHAIPQLVSLLQANQIFTGLSPAVREHLAQELSGQIEVRALAAGDCIFCEGEPGDALFLIFKGQVRISKMGRGGNQETLGLLPANEFFGEMALLDGMPRSAQATATEPTTLGRVDNCAFAQLLASAPGELPLNFLRSTVRRLREVNTTHITELMRSERLSLVGSMSNSIVHDLKNPIQVIQSCTELIASQSTNETTTQVAELMQRAVHNMLDMTQELLDFARGQTSLQMAEIDASEVIAEVESQLPHLLPRDVELRCEVVPAGCVKVDKGRFARMLLNLVKNAVEAMPKGGRLTLRLQPTAEGVQFSVSDTGCGIPPELQKKIFEPFVTFGKSKGTGLGMAIVKSVAEAHGGRVSLESEVGVGTTLRVLVPRGGSPDA